ncbi:MAG TPA: hypothetical protein VFY17_00745 [Pilimelia sp.]|nr:hypothetical protein [Pilimelia sp.]
MRLTPFLRHCAAVALGAAATLSWLDAPAVSAPAAPDGRIPLAVLADATLELPAWPAEVARPCPAR